MRWDPLSIGLLVFTALLAAASGSLWLSFALLEDQHKCTTEEKCQSLPLPGEQEAHALDAMKYELKSYYLGERTCAWFDAKQDRCHLPHEGDLCFDLVNWKDKADHGCEHWSHYIDPSKHLYSPRQTGEDARCNVSPQNANYTGNKTMSVAEIRDMKHACCVCGAHRDERNYEGSLNAKFPGSFDQVTRPPQHRGKPATHLTQCCACANQDTKKRGGQWSCKRTNKDTDSEDWFVLGEPNVAKANVFISAIVVSVASGLFLLIFLLVFCLRDTPYFEMNNKENAQLLLQL
jgi:hypothetical protein